MINPNDYAKQVEIAEEQSKKFSATHKYMLKYKEENEQMIQEIISLKHVISECEDNLKSMVEQYCRHNEYENVFGHDFMSAGECTFEYLVARGIAEYTENGVDIRMPKSP